MTRFEELQEIWQSQPQTAAALDIRDATDALNRFGRRQHIINAIKAACIALQTWYCFSRLGLSVYTVAGQALFVTGMVMLLLADWRAQMSIARLDFSSPSSTFIEGALMLMNDPNAGYRRRLGLSLALVSIGINLESLSEFSAETLVHRLEIHGAVTAVMLIAVLTLGLKLHAKRCELEYRPIRQRLTAIKLAMEEQRQ